MVIQVRLFAGMAQGAGMSAFSIELPPGATVADAVARLRSEAPAMPWAPCTMLAINQEYVGQDRELTGGDELAIIPPVSGGGVTRGGVHWVAAECAP